MTSKGILAFAQGQEFLRLAVIQLRRLRAFTAIPVAYIIAADTLNTDEVQTLKDLGAELIVADSPAQSRSYDLSREWRNLGRDQALDLSPFEKTLLVDVDYILQSKAAIALLDADLPLVCNQWHQCFEQEFVFDNPTIGAHGIAMLWATLLWFDKGALSRALFARWKEVLKFMKWRQEFYKFHSSLIRNDYALSIAAHELEQEQLMTIPRAPYSQMAIPPWCTYKLKDETLITISATANAPAQVLSLQGLDFHAFNKTNLLEVYK